MKQTMPALMQNLELCLIHDAGAGEPASRAICFAATLAAGQGARVYASGTGMVPETPFYGPMPEPLETPEAWAAEAPTRRILLRACQPGAETRDGISQVLVELEGWHSEATLFAASALADLNGDPDAAPLVPQAHYAAHTIGYAVFTALVGLHAQARRNGRTDTAVLNGLAVLGWVNWKAGAAGAIGQEVTRSGAMAEWPVLPCADGHVAILFTERDWPAMVEMVGDDRLAHPDFATFKGRETHRARYLPILRDWCAARDKATIRAAMSLHQLPGEAVLTIADVLDCPLLRHREAFVAAGDGLLPRAPERVLDQTPAAKARPRKDAATGDLPLTGLRVLDLGIITAGAGVGAVLADMGAEVLKIESATYPDPFRQWAGSDASPLFKFNNRNKYGLAIDLKTPDGKARFLELVAGADIVVENFRRGVMDRLGLGFATLAAANPAILLASISGQGPDGPGTQGSTFGSTLEANGGFATLTRDSSGQPFVTGRALNYPDQIICLYGAAMAASAAMECRRSGQGLHMDIAQRDTALYQIGDVVHWVSRGMGENPASLREGTGLRAFDGIVTSADGVHLALSLPPGADVSRVEGLGEDVAAWAAGRTAQTILESFRAAGFGVAEAVRGSQMIRDPAIRKAGVFTKGPDGAVVKGFPFQFRNHPMTVFANAPTVGEHNARFDLMLETAG